MRRSREIVFSLLAAIAGSIVFSIFLLSFSIGWFLFVLGPPVVFYLFAYQVLRDSVLRKWNVGSRLGTVTFSILFSSLIICTIHFVVPKYAVELLYVAATATISRFGLPDSALLLWIFLAINIASITSSFLSQRFNRPRSAGTQ
jgi:hypothetical protein